MRCKYIQNGASNIKAIPVFKKPFAIRRPEDDFTKAYFSQLHFLQEYHGTQEKDGGVIEGVEGRPALRSR